MGHVDKNKSGLVQERCVVERGRHVLRRVKMKKKRQLWHKSTGITGTLSHICKTGHGS